MMLLNCMQYLCFILITRVKSEIMAKQILSHNSIIRIIDTPVSN